VARTYQAIWDKVKATDVGEALVSKDRLATVRQAVIKLKCEENIRRLELGKPGYGKLEISISELSAERGIWKITFKLLRHPDRFRSSL
jgi:hypothetical protein